MGELPENKVGLPIPEHCTIRGQDNMEREFAAIVGKARSRFGDAGLEPARAWRSALPRPQTKSGHSRPVLPPLPWSETMNETSLLDGAVILRPDKKGRFDELLLMDGKECTVHMEMMDKNSLYVGIYPRGTSDGVQVWINAVKGRLEITHEAYRGDTSPLSSSP